MSLKTFAAAAAFSCLVGPAAALSVNTTVTDPQFAAACAASDAGAGGSGGQSCEFALAEMRIGAPGAEKEVYVQDPPGVPVDQQDFTWINGATNGFKVIYDGVSMLTLDVDGVSSSSNSVDLSGMTGMFIRARSDNADDTTTLSNLMLNGAALPGLAPDGSPTAAYLAIGDFDFASAWTLMGDIRFDWTGAQPLRSALGAQVKLTNLDVAPIPLPAAAWMLMAGLGALGGVAARKRRA